MEINTSEVLNAANTKWNFLDFKPGLVGGHCIGIDPYYLSHASRKNNSSTELINHSRHINATMASYICGIIVKKCFQKNISAKDCNVLFCGLSFKKDVSDVRNSQSISLLMELNQYFPNIKIHDSKLSYDSEKTFSNFEPFQIKNTETKFDLIVVSVGHSVYEDLGADYFNALKSDNGLLIDIPSMFDANLVDFQL
jgi:UDP-N-acetyl-D-galactosamine dehydrogenase